MGRELKRVPLSFNWPLNKIWSGYMLDGETKEPPKGDGYQLWETVSEGSPISPVFATPEGLAYWLATSPDYTWRNNDEGITREQWLSFILGPGWAPSFAFIGGRLASGVQALEKTKRTP